MPDEFAGAADEGLAELDFENEAGQAQAPAQAQPQAPEPAAQPAQDDDSDAFWESLPDYQPQAPTPEPGAGLSEQEALAALEELAETDPLQAADILAQMRIAQVEERMQHAVAPLLQRESEARAEDVVSTLEREFPSVDKTALAEIVSRDPERFDVAPQLQLERLRDVAELLALRSRAAYSRGDDIVAAIDNTVEQRDGFGVVRGQPRDASTGRFSSAVHVEGGSGPQPQMPVSDVDPIIAEIDASEPPRDVFGRRG
jgi:hypothetical protein